MTDENISITRLRSLHGNDQPILNSHESLPILPFKSLLTIRPEDGMHAQALISWPSLNRSPESAKHETLPSQFAQFRDTSAFQVPHLPSTLALLYISSK